MTQTAAGRVVEINQEIPAQDQVKSSQVGATATTRLRRRNSTMRRSEASTIQAPFSCRRIGSRCTAVRSPIEFRGGISSLAGRRERIGWRYPTPGSENQESVKPRADRAARKSVTAIATL